MIKINKKLLFKSLLIICSVIIITEIVLVLNSILYNKVDIIITNNNQSIYTDETIKIEYTINKDNYPITFISDSPNIATVDQNGIIKGINPGSTIIRLKNKKDIEVSNYAITILKVKDKLELNIDYKELDVDETFSIIAKLIPLNTINRNVTFKSTDENIINVDDNGLVTGINNGTADVIITTYEDITKSITFLVEQKPKELEVTNKINIIEDQTFSIISKVLPETTINKTLTYKSNNDSIAKVNNDGLVTGIKEGTTSIIVSVKNIEKEIPVTIKNKGINSITFLYQIHDVGDAIILESNNHYAMIDVGNKESDETNIILNYLKSKNVTKLDFVLITHAHDDHIGGLEKLAKNIKIEKLYVKNYNSSKFTKSVPSVYTKGLSSAKNSGTKVTYINDTFKDGDNFKWQDMKLTLYNTQKLSSTGNCPSGTCSGGNDNFNSVIVLVECSDNRRVILPGDYYDREEYNKITKTIGDVDVMKLPHHGFFASGSSRSAFKNLKAEYAIVTNSNPSTKGKNYTLPTEGVINYIPSGTKIYYSFDYKYVTVKLYRGKDIEIKLGSKR